MVKAKFLKSNPKSIEQLLIYKGIISKRYLRFAQQYSSKYKSTVTEALLNEGYISDQELANTFSDYFNTPYVDLRKFLPDPSILSKKHLNYYIKLNFIPWKKDKGITYVAATNIKAELIKLLEKIYGKKFKVVITTQSAITRAIQRNFSTTTTLTVQSELKKIYPKYSAYYLLTTKQKITITLFLIVLLFLASTMPYKLIIFLIITSNIIIAASTIFKFFIFSNAFKREIGTNYTQIKDHSLPVYTVLLPLHKEKHTILNLLNNIRQINYPKSKLDVIILVEQFDKKTIRFLNRLGLEGFFRIICIPKSYPQTKPKACSYGLKFAMGKYITIYDAEDKPDPNQLLKAVQMFRSSPKKVVCLQSRLNYYNRDDNFLSSSFAIEYSVWFDFLLKGLENLRIPIPLGGTSNHFKKDKLQQLKGWDPYNVAEDADLGYRLAKYGYTTKILDSYTMEESPVKLKTWLLQRARWIKGHIQTYIVHLRTLNQFKHHLSKLGIVGFHFFLILPIATYLVQVFLPFTFFIQADTKFLAFIKLVTMINGAFWIIISIFFAICAVIKNNWRDMNYSILLHPFYYLLHSIAFFIAFYQLLFKPHYWSKTLRKLDF